jgi:hypothetical protein
MQQIPAKSFGLGAVCLSLLVCLIGACANASGKDAKPMDLDLTVIRGGVYDPGPHKDPGIAWITDRATFDALLARLDRDTLPARETGAPEIDFGRDGVLLIRMGEKPSGGYALTLSPERSCVQGRTACVAVQWIEPDKGAMVTQALTRPYLLVRMRKGAYQRIVVKDQHGHERLALDLASFS